MIILYYDCFAGISGDMNLAALLDIGVDKEYLLEELKKLEIQGYEIKISSDQRRGIHGTRVDVLLAEESRNIRFNLPVNLQHSQSGMPHKHDENRTFKDILQIINDSKLNENVKDLSIKIFSKVAEAESKVHNTSVGDVHFHEVGAIDSIVDIVGAAICIDYIKPDKIICSPVELGSGMVKCAHGTFPVPAPATSEILRNIPVKTGNVPFEATTPTGAAIVASLASEFTRTANFKIVKTGYGIGHKDSEVPNVLRVFLAEEENDFTRFTQKTVVLECNIDDMNPEIYEYLIEKALNLGADDVFLTPVIMKKSRPATMLSILCKPSLLQSFVNFALTETSTLGVRHYLVTRNILKREIISIETRFGKIRVKKSEIQNGNFKYKPEYEDCLKISKEQNIPLIEIINEVQEKILNMK